jgi:hypothetical protein
MAEEKSPNPNAGESGTPSDSIDHAPSSDESQATDLPSANAPSPKEKKPAAKDGADKPAAKAKKEKAPAVEDKPFTEFIEQDYLPSLKTAFIKQGINDVEVTFVKDKIQISGLSKADTCWQVAGSWKNGQRQFKIYFPGEDINKQKAFSWATNGTKPSTLESFMIDERKVTLDLLVFYTMQRLNAQKSLAWN